MSVKCHPAAYFSVYSLLVDAIIYLPETNCPCRDKGRFPPVSSTSAPSRVFASTPTAAATQIPPPPPVNYVVKRRIHQTQSHERYDSTRPRHPVDQSVRGAMFGADPRQAALVLHCRQLETLAAMSPTRSCHSRGAPTFGADPRRTVSALHRRGSKTRAATLLITPYNSMAAPATVKDAHLPRTGQEQIHARSGRKRFAATTPGTLNLSRALNSLAAMASPVLRKQPVSPGLAAQRMDRILRTTGETGSHLANKDGISLPVGEDLLDPMRPGVLSL